ncbi:MAG: hypothetical protein ACI4LX_03365 [Treponema sp.]
MKKIYPVIIFSLLFFSCISTDADLPSADTSSQTPQENLQVQPVEQNQEPKQEEIQEPEQEQDTESQEEQNQLEQEKTQDTLEEKIEADDFMEEPYPLEEKIPESELADDFAELQKNIEDNFEEKIENLDDELLLPPEADEKQEEPLPPQPAQTPQVKQPEKPEQPSSPAQTAVPKQPAPQPEPAAVQSKPEQTESKPQETKNTSMSMQEEVSQIMNSENQENLPEPIQETPPVCSRSVTIKNNQYLDINYPGTGWVYLGEHDRQNLLVFFSRKITGSNTTFTLMSRKSGTAILHFYKNDALSGKYIDDYIQVQIEQDSATDNNHVTAPEYAKTIPQKPKKTYTEELTDIQVQTPEPTSENTPEKNQADIKSEQTQITEDNIQTNIKNTALPFNAASAETESTTPETKDTATVTQKQNDSEANGNLLELAKNAYSQKQYEQALQFVNGFLDSASEKIDEGIFLKAQILEARSAVQNIKEAISNYDRIVSDFPQSTFWNKSKERSLYLKRFYIDIR